MKRDFCYEVVQAFNAEMEKFMSPSDYKILQSESGRERPKLREAFIHMDKTMLEGYLQIAANIARVAA